MIHTRTIRIDGIDGMKYYKVMKVDVGLSRKKEWFLKIKEFNIEAVDDKISCAKDKIKDQLRQLHKDYVENNLEDSIKTLYEGYTKQYYGRSRIPQAETIKRLREEHRNSKLKKDESTGNGV